MGQWITPLCDFQPLAYNSFRLHSSDLAKFLVSWILLINSGWHMKCQTCSIVQKGCGESVANLLHEVPRQKLSEWWIVNALILIKH